MNPDEQNDNEDYYAVPEANTIPEDKLTKVDQFFNSYDFIIVDLNKI